MLVNAMTQNDNFKDAATVSAHRCIGCLRGSDAGKRDCAIRRLLAEGFAPEAIFTARTSSKTAH